MSTIDRYKTDDISTYLEVSQVDLQNLIQRLQLVDKTLSNFLAFRENGTDAAITIIKMMAKVTEEAKIALKSSAVSLLAVEDGSPSRRELAEALSISATALGKWEDQAEDIQYDEE